MDEVISLYEDLGYKPKRRGFLEKGVDIIGDFPPTEVKSWNEDRPSYSDFRYWRRLIHSQILNKFGPDGMGIVVNTCQCPVEYRDKMRARGIIYVYKDPKRGRRYHLQALKVAVLQLFSLRDLFEGTLQCMSRRNGFEEVFEVKNVEKDVGGFFLGFSPLSNPSVIYLIPLQTILLLPSQYHSLDLLEHIGKLLQFMVGDHQ